MISINKVLCLTLLMLCSSLSRADNITVAYDFNYITTSSDSVSDRNSLFSLPLGNQFFFQVRSNDRNKSQYWITDGTPDGTQRLEDDLFDGIIDFVTQADGHLFVSQDVEGSTDSRLVKFNVDTLESVEIEIPPDARDRTIMRVGEKYIGFRTDTNAIYIYDMLADQFSSYDLVPFANFREDQILTVGDYVLFNNAVFDRLWSLDIAKGTVVSLGEIRVVFGNAVNFNNRVYFNGEVFDSGNFSLYSSDGTLVGTTLENTSIMRSMQVVGSYLVGITDSNELVVFDQNGNKNTILLDHDIRAQSFKIAKFGQSFYYLGLDGIYQTDLQTEASAFILYEDIQAPDIAPSEVTELVVQNGKLYTYAGSQRFNLSNRLEKISGTAIYSVDVENGVLIAEWSRFDLEIVSRIHESSDYLFYAAQADTGNEPHFLDFRSNEVTILEDINKDTKTADSLFFTQSAYNRVHVEYAPAFSGLDKEVRGFTLEDSSFQPYLGPKYLRRNIDSRFDYHISKSIDSVTGVVFSVDFLFFDVELDAYIEYPSITPLVPIWEESGVNRGDMVFATFDSLYFYSVDGLEILPARSDFTKDIYINDEYLIFHRFDSSDREFEFYFYRDREYLGEFIIECNEDCNDLLPSQSNGVLLLQADVFDTSSYLYIHTGGAELNVVDVRSWDKRFEHVLSSTQSTLLTDGGGIYRLDHDTWELEFVVDGRVESKHEPQTFGYYNLVFNNLGEVLIFDENLNFQSKIDLLSESLLLRPNFTSAYLECTSACYLNLDRSQDELFKFYVDGEILSVELIDIVFDETLLVDGMNLLVDADGLFGREIYRFETSDVDSDNDGLPDGFEMAHNLNKDDPTDAELDIDGDGISNYREFLLNSSLLRSDTDKDGLDDGYELEIGLNPVEYDLHLVDHDGDGLSYRVEQAVGTDFNNSDTDGDGVNDSEDQLPLDSRDHLDFDGDGVGNSVDSDDDEDGIPDSWENSNEGMDSLNPEDANGDFDLDGLSNLQEFENGTDPNIRDDAESSDDPGGGGGPVAPACLIVLSLFCFMRRMWRLSVENGHSASVA